MRTIRNITLALALSAGLATAAQAHPFIGVGIVGGPVFPVASSGQSAPPLPVYPHAAVSSPAPLPPEAPPPFYAESAVGNLAAIMGHAPGGGAVAM